VGGSFYLASLGVPFLSDLTPLFFFADSPKREDLSLVFVFHGVTVSSSFFIFKKSPVVPQVFLSGSGGFRNVLSCNFLCDFCADAFGCVFFFPRCSFPPSYVTACSGSTGPCVGFGPFCDCAFFQYFFMIRFFSASRPSYYLLMGCFPFWQLTRYNRRSPPIFFPRSPIFFRKLFSEFLFSFPSS